jgi:hypothetical protein
MDACPAVSNALDMIRAHFWRAAALVLLVLFLLQWAQSVRLSGELEQVRAALTIATDTAEVSGEMRAAAEEAAGHWESVAADLRARLLDSIEQARVQRERDALALAAARAAERDADSTLRMWLDRYAAAVREPACAAQMEQKLCVALE